HAGLSDALRQRLAGARKLTLEDYRVALGRRRDIRERYAAVSARCDGFATLAATGAAPVGLGWTGDPAFNVPASLLGTPAVSLPLLSEADMPLGLQLIGRGRRGRPPHGGRRMGLAKLRGDVIAQREYERPRL